MELHGVAMYNELGSFWLWTRLYYNIVSINNFEFKICFRSKLHLVDLAGSERVAKTKIHGQQLNEAKFINLSLHHLEGVIIALQQEASGGRAKISSPNFALYNR